MKQHGMLFKGVMVNKLLDKVAPKTQTRRPITFSNSICTPRVRRDEWADLRWGEARLMSVTFPVPEKGGFGERSLPGWRVPFRAIFVMVYPRIWPGDIIWVRETFALYKAYDHLAPNDLLRFQRRQLGYIADGILSWFGKKRSSMLMPRWASRIDLLVLAMRSERVQEISEVDARAEGVQVLGYGDYPQEFSGKHLFRKLWDSINIDRGFPWDGNHPVWIHDFKEVEG